MIVAGIPAYNEEKTIAKVILLAQKHVDVVVVCDDGSQDLTADIAQRLGAIVIRHEKNRGYGAAVQALFEKARALNADLLLTLDADGQHDPIIRVLSSTSEKTQAFFTPRSTFNSETVWIRSDFRELFCLLFHLAFRSPCLLIWIWKLFRIRCGSFPRFL